ncbi:MAG: gamma-glutamyltransferase [Trueperaceae bacterium]|nr:gamma-glutamyltransferase [Trueperaceae bacterium]
MIEYRHRARLRGVCRSLDRAIRTLLLAGLLLVIGVACDLTNGASWQHEGTYAITSAHYAATEAGIRVLETGGSAADAAVAVATALSVVEPWFSSVLGGGTWALYYDAETGNVTSLDGVGPVGSGASVADYESRVLDAGMHQAIVPGAWDGWMLWLARYGRLPLGEVLAPAIQLAREGHPASPELVAWLRRDRNLVLSHPPSAAIYAPEGELLNVGDTVYQRALAQTLEAIVAAFDAAADQGRSARLQAARDHVYRGPVADAIVAASDAGGGYLTTDDFASFAAEIVEPISIQYEDVEVFQNPPNSQGITMLLALNILNGFDLAAMDPDDPDAVHLQVEALKLAFADRNAYVGDPERVDLPTEQLLSQAHAERQRARIALDDVLEWPIAPGLEPESIPPPDLPTGTTTFHVLDAEGNAAAVTTSLGAQFLVVGDTGVHINNRMRFLALEEGDPNRLTPGFKVRHTSNPYMVLHTGRPYVLGGNTGVDTQPQGQLQQFLSVHAFGTTPQDAIDRPRFVSTAFPASTYPYRVRNTLQLELDYPRSLRNALEAKGHDVHLGQGIFGSANMLVVDVSGVAAGSESRTSSGAHEVFSDPVHVRETAHDLLEPVRTARPFRYSSSSVGRVPPPPNRHPRGQRPVAP